MFHKCLLIFYVHHLDSEIKMATKNMCHYKLTSKKILIMILRVRQDVFLVFQITDIVRNSCGSLFGNVHIWRMLKIKK